MYDLILTSFPQTNLGYDLTYLLPSLPLQAWLNSCPPLPYITSASIRTEVCLCLFLFCFVLNKLCSLNMLRNIVLFFFFFAPRNYILSWALWEE